MKCIDLDIVYRKGYADMKCGHSQKCDFDFGESLFASINLLIVIPRENKKAFLMEPSVANSLVKRAKVTLWTSIAEIIVLEVRYIFV